MRPIPPALRKQLSEDPFMSRCVYTGETKDISFEHCWIYSGRQINEWWAIVPLARRLNTSSMPLEIKNYCRWISLIRAKPSDLAKYPKKNWEQERKYLDKLFLKV